LAAAGVLVVGAAAWPYTVDDAFITARYARNLATGLGYGMNPHQPDDGVTGPLWLVPGVLASLLGADPVAVAKGCGLGCAVLATWLALRRLRQRARGGAAAGVAAVLLLCSPSLGTWAVAGLETGAATLLLTGAVLAATRRPRPDGWLLGACIGLLAWLRPELVLSCAVLLGHVALRQRDATLRASCVAGLGAASALGFRALAFGHWLPLALEAKAGTLEQGLRYTAQSVLLATSLAGLWLCYLGVRRGRGDDRAVGLALLAQLVAVVLAGGDWMPGYRLLVPLLPSYATLAGVGAARGFARRPWLGAVAVALACAVPGFDLATRIPELQGSALARERAEPLVVWLHAHARRVALVDVGYLGYRSGVEVVDLAGLTDARIARMPGGHLSKRVDPAYFAARGPDAIVLHSASPPSLDAQGRLRGFAGFAVEHWVAAMPFVRANYTLDHVLRYAPRYYYLVLRREPGHYGRPR
jgi:arabinofuranosyltransferase